VRGPVRGSRRIRGNGMTSLERILVLVFGFLLLIVLPYAMEVTFHWSLLMHL
jgi:uncharacterized membrane protein